VAGIRPGFPTSYLSASSTRNPRFSRVGMMSLRTKSPRGTKIFSRNAPGRSGSSVSITVCWTPVSSRASSWAMSSTAVAGSMVATYSAENSPRCRSMSSRARPASCDRSRASVSRSCQLRADRRTLSSRASTSTSSTSSTPEER